MKTHEKDSAPAGVAYDEVPYSGGVVPFADCAQLELVGLLRGISPGGCESARVLELGCGSGENLLAQAQEFPEAHFIGIDASASAIARGRKVVDELGLPNLDFRCHELEQVDISWGAFDYIICHGVYSWVPRHVRIRILEIYAENLAPQGVGYVSYNALPGWHLRQPVRDLIRFHSAACSSSQEAVEAARDILALTVESHDGRQSAYAELMRDEYHILSSLPDGYLYHEMMEETNDPMYFRDFIRGAEDLGLQYLGEASVLPMLTDDLPQRVRELVDTHSLLQREQYLDFLRNCAFRRTLLCHAELSLHESWDLQRLDRLYFGLAEEADLDCPGPSPAATAVVSPEGSGCGAEDQGFGSILAELERIRPEMRSFVDLERLTQDQGRSELMDCLWKWVGAGILDVGVRPPRLTSQVGASPLTTPLARLQAKQGNVVSSQKHRSVHLSDLARFILQKLDGQHDVGDLVDLTQHELRAGRIRLMLYEQGDERELVDRTLRELTRSALLVG